MTSALTHLPIARPRRRVALRAVGRGALWVWASVTIVLVALLMVSHVLALPTPAARSIELALARMPADSPPGTWRAFHVLYADCPCSRRIGEALALRGARADVAERVMLVGHDAAIQARLEGGGFRVAELTRDELRDRYGFEAAPAFFVVGPDGTVRYVGGYTREKQGPAEDGRILDLVRGGARPEALPVFGCAVSRRLQAAADPLGLRYTREETAP